MMRRGLPASECGREDPRAARDHVRVRDESELRQAMLADMGDKIAKLFYKWKPDEETPEGTVVVHRECFIFGRTTGLYSDWYSAGGLSETLLPKSSA